jgi:hypothetical protein
MSDNNSEPFTLFRLMTERALAAEARIRELEA